MALHLFPQDTKVATVSDGTKYAYIQMPTTDPANKVTFLLLHGFPSTTFDWRHVVPLLRDRGHGVIAPDLLGYGDSEKPSNVEAYSLKRMANHVIELIKHEGLEKVVGIGHDWGSTLLSTAALLHPSHFAGLVFTAVGYTPPEPFDLHSVNSMVEKFVGYPAFAYMEFFNEDSAAELCDAHPASVTSMMYSTKPEDWKEQHMGITGAAKKWVSEGKTSPSPSWMSDEEVAAHVEIFKRNRYQGPLNWYKAFIRGIDASLHAEFQSDESKNLNIPSVVVTAKHDYGSRPEFQIPAAQKYLSNKRVEQLDCGHWIPLEKPVELVSLIDNFIAEI